VNQSWTVPMRSCNDISRKTAGTPLGAVGRGLAAGAVGTLAMDLLWYARYRRGVGVWAVDYAVLPAAGLYKPIQDYDRETLAKDLTAHLVYGATTAAALRPYHA
jgi:hypothetical protein